MKVVKQAEILDGVGIETAPALKGYVRFQARPTADTILMADREDPLLVRWQYGLGRAAVFTSDAKNRWAANWVTWPGFDKLWANIFRDLLAACACQRDHGRFRPRQRRTGGGLPAGARRGRAEGAAGHLRHRPERIPDPDEGGQGGGRTLSRPRQRSGSSQGLFRIRPLAESRAFPEVGFYRQEDEMQEYGNNEQLLRQIAASTGGRYNPRPRDVFDASGRSIATVMDLWPGLLVLALLLNLAELVLRKWKGLLEALHLRPVESEA